MVYSFLSEHIYFVECYECVRILISDLAEADFNLTDIAAELADVLVHANDSARLNAINESVNELRVNTKPSLLDEKSLIKLVAVSLRLYNINSNLKT